MSTVTITIENDFLWDDYVDDVVQCIVRASEPVHVVWNLTKLTRMSYSVVPKQLALLQRLGDKLWSKIIDSTILASPESKPYLDIAFRFYTPKKPVHIVT